MDARFAVFKDLDIDVVKQQRERITLLERESATCKTQLAKTEEIRGNLNSEKKTLVVQIEQYEQEVKTSIAHRTEIIKLIKSIRSEIMHADLKPESAELD